MGMFTPRLNTVFASRWKALWWAASILVTAYCSVPNRGEQDASADVVALAKLVAPAVQPSATQPSAAPPHHTNPWAKAAKQVAP